MTRPTAPLFEPKTLTCPKCGGQMPRVQGIEENAWRCTGCHGLWLDEHVHELLEDEAEQVDTGPERADIPLDHQGVLFCPMPECKGHQLIRMVDVERPDIGFESCKHCYGRYYDAGEYREINEDDFLDRIGDWLSALVR